MVEWLDEKDEDKVDSRICPDCGDKLIGIASGGLSINVRCIGCAHAFNDCLPVGVHRI